MDVLSPALDGRTNGALPSTSHSLAPLDLEQAQLEGARLEGARLVARTAAYDLNSALTPVVGFASLLAAHPLVQAEPRLARCTRLLLESALEAAARAQRLQQIVRLVEEPPGASPAPDLPFLDLAKSTAATAAAEEPSSL